MTLKEAMSKPLAEIVKDLDIGKVNIISDDNNNVVKIIVEYVPDTEKNTGGLTF